MTRPKPVRTPSAEVEASLCRSLRILFLAFLAAPADPGRRRSAAVRRFAALARLAARRQVPAEGTPTGRRWAVRWAAGRHGRRLLGRLVLLAVTVGAFAGAEVGLLGTPEAGASHNFGDVTGAVFYHDFVQFLVDNGITAGCGPGLFCGEQAVTRGQTAVFLKKLFDVLRDCPPDSVKAGTICIDRYEASVWEVPAANGALIEKIRAGTVTLEELQAGGFQRGAMGDDYGAGCPDTGNGCVDFYAVSLAGVMPSRFLTWFQAAAAARNAGKRLPTNGEWQAAALGTPDGTPCIVSAAGPGQAGTAGCVSDVAAFDMVGNVWEWVADWVPLSTGCVPSLFPATGDANCLAGASTVAGPAALLRGGDFGSVNAGVFAVSGVSPLSSANTFFGFRAAR